MAKRFERIEGTNVIILNNEGAVGRSFQFSSKDLVFNVDDSSVRLGPGYYDDCEVVIPPSGAVPAEGITVAETLYVYSRGTFVSVRYERNGSAGNKARYTEVGGTGSVAFGSGKWRITYGGTVRFESSDNVATPELVSTWSPVNGSVGPGPIVVRTLAANAQQQMEMLLSAIARVRIDRPAITLDGVPTDQATLCHATALTLFGNVTVNFGDYSEARLVCAQVKNLAGVLPGYQNGGSGGTMTLNFDMADGSGGVADGTEVVVTAICLP